MNTRTALLCLVAGSMTSAGLAQVVTPPPAQAPAPERNIPVKAPPQAPTQPPPQIINNPIPADTHARREPKKEVKLPDLPYKSLVELDAAGKLKPLDKPAEWAAMERNPTLKPEDKAKMADHLRQRRASIELVVIANVDLVQQIEDGFFETVDLKDNKNFSQVLNIAKPVKDPNKPLHDDLKAAQLMTEEQAAFNAKISGEYHAAWVAEQIKGKTDPRRGMALMYKQYLDEPVYIHHQLLIEAGANIDKALAGVKMEPAVSSQVTPLVACVKAAKTDDARLAAMKALVKPLNTDQRRDLLRATIALRPK